MVFGFIGDLIEDITSPFINLADNIFEEFGIPIDIADGFNDELAATLRAAGVPEETIAALKLEAQKLKIIQQETDVALPIDRRGELESTNIIDGVLEIVSEVFEKIEEFINGERDILNFKDLAEFMNLLVELLRAIINAFLKGLPISTQFIEFIVDTITEFLKIIIENKKTIEVILLFTPVLPFAYLLYKLVNKI